MPLLSLSDDQFDLLARMAEPLLPSHRSAFLEAVTARLATYTSDAIGLGSVHRVAAECQREFLKSGQVAVGPPGGKYGRPDVLRKAKSAQ